MNGNIVKHIYTIVTIKLVGLPEILEFIFLVLTLGSFDISG